MVLDFNIIIKILLGFFCYPKLSILGFLGFFGVKCYPFCQYGIKPIFIFSGLSLLYISILE